MKNLEDEEIRNDCCENTSCSDDYESVSNKCDEDFIDEELNNKTCEEDECCDGECEVCEDKESCQTDKVNICGCNNTTQKKNKNNPKSQACDCGEECDCGDDCTCDENNKCNDNCSCETDDINANCANKSKDEHNLDNEGCKCGCGEKLEETTADAYFKQLLSLQAEFDNYRKRTQSDISKAYQNGFNDAITQFIPALDSFKMATEYITDKNTLVGIQYIEKGILSTLEKMGISVIDTAGKFDPNFHQAIGSETSPEHESGDIIKECFKGFKMGDKIIRYAQVIVAK